MPQEPLIKRQAEQVAVVPPFKPRHVQFHGPVPEYGVLVPTEQYDPAGKADCNTQFDEPQVVALQVFALAVFETAPGPFALTALTR